MISNRHIRHDWKTFVDWEQNSVRTVCGVTTRRGLAGIPGVTPQTNVVVGPDGKRRWGWCSACCSAAYLEAMHIIHSHIASLTVENLYVKAAAALQPQAIRSK